MKILILDIKDFIEILYLYFSSISANSWRWSVEQAAFVATYCRALDS